MNRLSIARIIAGTAVAAALAGTAAAHHGWAWAEGEQTTLEGTIQSISFAPPIRAIFSGNFVLSICSRVEVNRVFSCCRCRRSMRPKGM